MEGTLAKDTMFLPVPYPSEVITEDDVLEVPAHIKRLVVYAWNSSHYVPMVVEQSSSDEAESTSMTRGGLVSLLMNFAPRTIKLHLFAHLVFLF